MRIPNVSQVFRGLGLPANFQIVKKTIEDHEVVESNVVSEPITMILHPMKARELLLKPEGQRRWKWLSGWSTERLSLDWTLVAVSDGLRYRIMNTIDWSQAGYYEYELVQGPFK